ncbi:MAG: hypothetical protein AAFO77_06845 [Pseudomonadota bacterium]
MWPVVKALIEQTIGQRQCLILQGSALRPEFLIELAAREVKCHGLYASADFIRRRIEVSSDYRNCSSENRTLIRAFITRTIRDNEEVKSTAETLGLELTEASNPPAVETLFQDLTTG